MTSRFERYRDVAYSSAAATVETFLPRRLLHSPAITAPADLVLRVASTTRAVSGIGRGLLLAAEDIPRLLTGIHGVITDVETLLIRIHNITTQTELTVHAVQRTHAHADATVTEVHQIQERAGQLIDRCVPVVDAVDGIEPNLIALAGELFVRLEPLLAAVSRLEPTVPAQAAALLARSGPLLDQADTILLPLLTELHRAVPDVRDILPVVQRLEPVMVDVETRIAGLPGSARLRRRGEHVIEEAMSDTD